MPESGDGPRKCRSKKKLSLGLNQLNIGIEKLHIKEVRKPLLWALVEEKVMLMSEL
jgi:hypothetical protein